MNWLKWQRGRQGSGYDKLLLACGTWPLTFDMYILKFPINSYIDPHVDTVTTGKHFRLNIVLKCSKFGGEFICGNSLYNSERIKLFRPDVDIHCVTRVTGSSRYVLSIGWVR